jgi:hypothetical protein
MNPAYWAFSLITSWSQMKSCGWCSGNLIFYTFLTNLMKADDGKLRFSKLGHA